MINFSYARVSTTKEAVSAVASDSSAMWIAGGTNLVDLCLDVASPLRCYTLSPMNKGNN